MSQTQTQSDSNSVPDPRYTASNRKCYDTQQDVTDAWAAGDYPTHNVARLTPQSSHLSIDVNGLSVALDREGAVLYTWGGERQPRSRFGRRRPRDNDGPDRAVNFYGVQHFDGSGTLWHYDTREAIRTRNGLIINNQQCWSQGFARCSPPSKDDRDAELPIDALSGMLDDGDTVYDITEVRGQPQMVEDDYYDEPRERYRVDGSIAVVEGEDRRYGIYIGRDASSADYKHRHFAMRLSADELAEIDTPSDVTEEMLTPREVRESDMDVVTSTEYARTHLEDDELEAHREAGGHTTKSQSRWRDKRINRQEYRADLQGNTIVRQGEWFFIPTEIDRLPVVGRSYARDELGNHIPSRFKGARAPLPTECGECGATSLATNQDGDVRCNECGTFQGRPVYVRGEITHSDGDHDAINLGDTWHRAVTHGRSALMYRTGVPEDRISSGGGGWD